MTLVQQKLIDAYTVLVLANIKTIDQVPTTVVTLADGTTQSTIKDQTNIKVAEKTVEILGGQS